MKTLHRIFTPIIALLTIPAAIFLPFFRIMVAQGSATTETGGKVNILDGFGLGEYISLKDLFTFIKNGATEGTNLILDIVKTLTSDGEFKLTDVIPGIHWGVVFLVFFALTIIIALVIAVVAAVTKRPKISVWLSVGGIISALIMNASFNTFAKPILAGALNLDSLLSSVMGNSLGQLGGSLMQVLGMSYSVDYMKLSVAYTAILLLFIVIFIFSAASTFDEKKR